MTFLGAEDTEFAIGAVSDVCDLYSRRYLAWDPCSQLRRPLVVTAYGSAVVGYAVTSTVTVGACAAPAEMGWSGAIGLANSVFTVTQRWMRGPTQSR